DRGGLRLQDNRQTGCHYPPRSFIHFDHPPRPSIHRFDYLNHDQSGYGRLWLQDNRQAGQSTFDHRSTTHNVTTVSNCNHSLFK
ncbi:hypothetical protein ACN38_g10681, partial [Penicillium nordicum]